jgi:hypothetical protein
MTGIRPVCQAKTRGGRARCGEPNARSAVHTAVNERMEHGELGC